LLSAVLFITRFALRRCRPASIRTRLSPVGRRRCPLGFCWQTGAAISIAACAKARCRSPVRPAATSQSPELGIICKP